MKRMIAAIVCLVMATMSLPAMALSETREAAIVDRCDTIRDDLRSLQRSDSKARVYLGRYYEVILTKFITPLNIRLVENNLLSTGFTNNQNDFNKARTNFVIDYVEYQKGLEELVSIDCKSEPERFYERLVTVREKRAVVAGDVAKLRKLAGTQLELVQALRSKI